MSGSRARTVEGYLAEIPEERRRALAEDRRVILANLPEGYAEGMQYGMIGYHVPLARYADTTNGEPLGIAALASHKQHMSLYLIGLYGDPVLLRWFSAACRPCSSKVRTASTSTMRSRRWRNCSRDMPS